MSIESPNLMGQVPIFQQQIDVYGYFIVSERTALLRHGGGMITTQFTLNSPFDAFILVGNKICIKDKNGVYRDLQTYFESYCTSINGVKGLFKTIHFYNATEVHQMNTRQKLRII